VIGTNALTKSLHYDNIKVVAFLYVDSFLNMNDHRGREFTYDLISKVVTRDVVIVQTYAPGNDAIIWALTNDYERFYNDEIKNRELMNYNPYMEINRILISGSKENFHFGYYFRKVASHIPDVVILGPSYDARARAVKLLVKHNQFETIRKVFKDAQKRFKDPDLKISFQRYPRGM
jgi:primosomal protein N' (replication factor Y)